MYSPSRYGRFTTEKERPVYGPNGFWRTESHLPLPVSETRTVQPLASRYTGYATWPTHDLYSSPDIIRMTKSRRMTWAGHVARMGGREAHTGFCWGYLRERKQCEDLGVDKRIILRWIVNKVGGKAWIGLICLWIGWGSGLLWVA